MALTNEIKPKVSTGGLVTVAFLKARLDEGGDHLGTFMPLVIDVLPNLPNRNFTSAEVQEAIATIHGVSMPQEAVTTLLKRLARNHFVVRNAGRFSINPSPDKAFPRTNVSGEKALLEEGQNRLGDSLKKHAEKRGVILSSRHDAINMVLRFLEEEQITLLLGAPNNEAETTTISRRERVVVAEFIHDVVKDDPALTSVMKGILEGLVVYRAAFLPDLTSVERDFKDLTVIFDSVLVRQALGYEGISARSLAVETVDLLKKSKVQCVVFDKSVHEIQRILSMYEQKLATPAGRHSLKSVPMSRHFLTQCYSPSDVREMSALLERDIAAAGFRIVPTPPRTAEFTHREAKLAERLADPISHDIYEPRVLHDVDCIAGVLTLRRGCRSRRIEDARFVFATTSTLVIRNTKIWWDEDERESGVAPVVHIRSLANLAWLKKPATVVNFQLHELIALCAASMRPSQKTWQRFLTHLDRLQEAQRLTADEVTAIIVSAMSDRLLHDVESDEDDTDDLDAGTLDEVVERVISHYGTEAEKRVFEVTQQYEQRISETEIALDARVREAEEKKREIAENLRRRNLVIEARAQKWAQRIVGSIYWVVALIVVVCSIAVAFSNTFTSGLYGAIFAFAVILFTLLEVAGILGHLRKLKEKMTSLLQQRIRVWLTGDDANYVIEQQDG